METTHLQTQPEIIDLPRTAQTLSEGAPTDGGARVDQEVASTIGASILFAEAKGKGGGSKDGGGGAKGKPSPFNGTDSNGDRTIKTDSEGNPQQPVVDTK